MARTLALAGAGVVVIARTAAALVATTNELTSSGCRAAHVRADLGSRKGARSAADQAAEVFGEPDILVNSAGINMRPPMGSLDDTVWDRTMAVNLEAPYLLGQRFGPGMAERGFGRIINISSQQAFRAFVRSGAYGASKGALESLTRSQAEAWSASWSHLQHTCAGVRHDATQFRALLRSRRGCGAGRAHHDRPQRPRRRLCRTCVVPRR